MYSATGFVPVAEYISSPLAFIINNQILTRTFSKRGKIAQISLIPKANKPETPADYRPISVLPIPSKAWSSELLLKFNELIKFVKNSCYLNAPE